MENSIANNQIIKDKEFIIQELKKELVKKVDETKMLNAILNYILKYHLELDAAVIPMEEIAKLIIYKPDIKLEKNLGGGVFVKISFPPDDMMQFRFA